MPKSVGLWGTTLDHQHHQCLKTSPHWTILPNSAADDNFDWQSMSLSPSEATDSESSRMAFDTAKKEHGIAKKEHGTPRKEQETAKKEHGTTSASSSTLEWERALGIAAGYHHVLRTQHFPPDSTYPTVTAADPAQYRQ